MALHRDKKNEIVEEMSKVLASSKMTVFAEYRGTPVKAMQALRKLGKDKRTTVKVVKNRLVIKALQSNEIFKNIDTSVFNGMLLYAFNPEDEVASAQIIANFAKTQPTLRILGAVTNKGEFINTADANTLAALPDKDQLRALLVGTLSAPLNGFVNVLAGNVRGVLNVFKARAEQLS